MIFCLPSGNGLWPAGLGPYKKLAGQLINKPLPQKPFFVDNSKVSDHHAIIPTEQFVQLDHMTVDERRIYDLVVRRFLAVLYPPYESRQLSLTVKVGEEQFLARGTVVENLGWKAVYTENNLEYDQEDLEENREEGAGEERLKVQTIPDLKEGDCLERLAFTMTEGKTKPPAPL